MFEGLLEYFEALYAAYQYFSEGQPVSYTVGNVTLTVQDKPGAPNKLTFSQAIAAFEAVLAGKTGTMQIGDVTISISLAGGSGQTAAQPGSGTTGAPGGVRPGDPGTGGPGGGEHPSF